MKKRILGILFVLVALVALCAISVSAEDVVFPTDGTSMEAPCQHCDGATVTWLPLTQTVVDGWFVDASPDYYNFPNTDQHYYVSDDSITLNAYLSLGSKEKLCLHLNGKTLARKTNGARAVAVASNAAFNLMDHADNAGQIQGYAEDSSTGCVVRLGSSGAAFNMYGGTLKMLVGTESQASSGGCVYQASSTTFVMNGGVITGGNAKSFGGNLFVSAGATAQLLGGTITGGTSTSSGGNISNAGTLTIDGCTITGGSGTYGGNIRNTDTSTLNLLSGTVSGGYGSKDGGNIYSNGVINLGACAVENGCSATNGHNIRLDSKAQLTVKTTFTGLTTVKFANAHLPATFENGYLTDTLDGCEGTFTGKLYLEGTEQLVRLEGKADDTKLYTVIEEEDFSGTGAMVAKCQHCATQVVWRPLTADVLIGWNKNYSQANGTHYYLVDEKVKLSGTLTIEKGETLCLHLNGNTLDGTSTRPLRVYGTMNLMDHAASEGNLYGRAGDGTTGCVVRVENTFNMYGGNVQMVKGSYSRGGNGGTVYLEQNTAFNMYGGSITGGVGENGGNMYVGTGATATLLGGSITGGEALKIDSTDGYGGNIYISGNLVLGNCDVSGGTAAVKGSDLYFGEKGKLTVKSDFAGSTKLAMNAAHMPDPILGGYLTDTLDSCEGAFPGKLYLENSAYLPAIFGKEGDTKIYVSDTALVKKDGTTVWYGSAAEAMDAYDTATEYLFTGAAELVVDGGTYTVDLAGSDLAVSGSGTLTLFDSANKDGATYGTATVTGVTVANAAQTAVAGTNYYMLSEGDTYTFHCIRVGLSDCSIRPSSSGIYYTGTWSCDEKMAEQVESYGVAVSLVAMPGTDFAAEGGSCLYTAYGKDTLEAGTTKTGVIIEEILAEKETANRNNKNARRPIYAAAYMKLTDGTVIMGDVTGDFSLYSAMKHLDSLIAQNPGAYAEARAKARAFYQTWSGSGMGTWTEDLSNILARVEDGVLNLLMVGNSFCYYYVEELYDLLMADLPEGITAVNIYNLYYSGCRLDQHLTWWQNGTAKYEFYKTDASGRNLLGEKGEWTLEQALVMEDWDYISYQGMPSGGSYAKWEETELHLSVAEYAEPILDRFHELYPDAQLLWHRTWALEVGRVTDSAFYTEELCRNYDIGMQAVCDYMCNEWDKTQPYDLIQVNSGAIWQMVRDENAQLEESLLPFGGLTARLGYSTYGSRYNEYLEHIGSTEVYDGPTANSGDGQHDGDIGGGQLINAYAWYETLTGGDSTQSDYVPSYTRSGTTYTLSEALCALIRSSAHEVVSQMPETVQPAK